MNGILTLLHSERAKLHTILAFLNAIGLNVWIIWATESLVDLAFGSPH